MPATACVPEGVAGPAGPGAPAPSNTRRASWRCSGFFIGDGHLSARGGTPSFRLHKSREVLFLHQQADRAGYSLTGTGDRFYLRADDEFRLLAKRCYDDNRAKVIPSELFDEPVESLRELLAGLMHSDGSVSPSGKQTYHTTSRVLAGQVQALALFCGRSATVAEHPFTPGDGHHGTKTRYRVTMYRPRNMTPKVGWTTQARGRQVSLEDYQGTVFCVSVPNGTLYVRRNGKPAWSGNSPFEHNSMTFYVQAPIFVFREFMRHRIASYNEESGRYRELRAGLLRPGPRAQAGPAGQAGRVRVRRGHRRSSTSSSVAATEDVVPRRPTRAYLRMLDAGVAREVARGVLPVGHLLLDVRHAERPLADELPVACAPSTRARTSRPSRSGRSRWSPSRWRPSGPRLDAASPTPAVRRRPRRVSP